MSSKYNRRRTVAPGSPFTRADWPDGGVTCGIDCGGVDRDVVGNVAVACGDGDRFEMLGGGGGGAIGFAGSALSGRIGAAASAFGTAGDAGIARPSLDVATLIFLWLTRIPKCAMSALSTFRTVCFGDTSSVVRMCISSTEPVPLATIRAEMTPGRVASNSSAR
jgi:hypothetical protein